jgi:hypothetical protein
LRELTANLLRVARGAGQPYAVMQQSVAFLEACEEYRDKLQRHPSDHFTQMLNTGPDFDAPDLNHAEHTIVRGALQMTASRLLGQVTQERNDGNELRASREPPADGTAQ